MKQNTDKILLNLKKTQSMINRLVTMLEGNEYCIDIMQQNLAAIGLLKSVQAQLFERHLNSCFKTAMQSSNERKKQEMIDEIFKVTKFGNK